MSDVAPGAHADVRTEASTATEATQAIGWSSLGYGLSVGYGHGFAARSRQSGRDVASVQVLTLEPQVRMTLSSVGAPDAWYHGRVEGTLEALFMLNVTPQSGFAGGANAGLRYRFRPDHRIQPYAEAAIGLGGLDFDLASQADGFTFFLSAGAGARWQIDDTLSLIGSLRWQHISNAQTKLPNTGIDTIGFRIGVELR